MRTLRGAEGLENKQLSSPLNCSHRTNTYFRGNVIRVVLPFLSAGRRGDHIAELTYDRPARAVFQDA